MPQSWYGHSRYELETFKMPLSTTQLHSLCVPSLRFSNWFQTKFRPILRKQEVYKKHDYTVQITPAAVCLIYTLMISSPSNKSIAVYLWMCSFVWPKAAHLHQTLQWHQCLLVITATCPVHWSINATSVYLLFHWDTDKLKDFILNCQNCFSVIELRRLKPKKSKWHF